MSRDYKNEDIGTGIVNISANMEILCLVQEKNRESYYQAWFVTFSREE
jgi:hypothetical protein